MKSNCFEISYGYKSNKKQRIYLEGGSPTTCFFIGVPCGFRRIIKNFTSIYMLYKKVVKKINQSTD